MRVLHFSQQKDDIRNLRKDIAEAKPDIVHIHGCWSLAVWRADMLCRKHNIIVVFSPHRMLEPWHIADGYWLKKLPMLLLFQRAILRHAKAVEADTAQERDNLLTLSVIPLLKRKHPLNANIVATIRPKATSETATDSPLYRKVVDTYPRLCMTPADIRAENILLRLGMTQDSRNITLSEEELKASRDITDETWRRIQLHAYDEGVLEEVLRGAETVRIAARNIDISGIDRFERDKHTNNQPLKTTEAMMHPLRLEEISEEEKATANDIFICKVILNLRYEMLHDTISKRHLCDTYAALRFTDFDEDRVVKMLSLLQMRRFARRVLHIMTEMFRLEEGFTFDKPLNDDTTAKMRRRVER